MTRFASSVAAAALVFGLATAPCVARAARFCAEGAPPVPQGLSIDGIRAGQPAPSDPMEDAPGTPGRAAPAP